MAAMETSDVPAPGVAPDAFGLDIPGREIVEAAGAEGAMGEAGSIIALITLSLTPDFLSCSIS